MQSSASNPYIVGTILVHPAVQPLLSPSGCTLALMVYK